MAGKRLTDEQIDEQLEQGGFDKTEEDYFSVLTELKDLREQVANFQSLIADDNKHYKNMCYALGVEYVHMTGGHEHLLQAIEGVASELYDLRERMASLGVFLQTLTTSGAQLHEGHVRQLRKIAGL